MKRRPSLLTYFLVFVSIYPLLIFVIVMTVLGTRLLFNFVPRLSDIVAEPTSTPRTWRLAILPTGQSVSTPVPEIANTTQQGNITSTVTQEQIAQPALSATTVIVPDAGAGATVNKEARSQANAQEPASPARTSIISPSDVASNSSPVVTTSEQIIQPVLPTPSPTLALDFSVFSGTPSFARVPRPTPRSTPESILDNLVNGLISALRESDSTPASRPKSLPTLTPTPTGTNTSTPTATPTNTPTPIDTPTPTNTSLPTNTPLPTYTPMPSSTPTATPIPPPTAAPLPSSTPIPEYDFLLNEFYNSPTTNHFLVMYVAVVDGNDIPIGDMKVVGTRLDHNLTYESPLTTWYYEGYNAPGEQIKTGNTKFEPPGGIESTSWLLHLEDAYGNRMSDDIPFDVDENDRQWYFVKFRRKF